VIRARAVELLEQGIKPAEVSQKLGVSVASIYNWRKQHRESGDLGMATKPRSGRPKKIDDKKLKEFARMITTTRPSQWNNPEELWGGKVIALELTRRHTLEVNRWTLRRWMDQMGIEQQRPHVRNWEKLPDQLGDWARRHLPSLKERARQLDARVYVSDISTVRTESIPDQTYLEAPKILDYSMISAVSIAGPVRFMFTRPNISAGTFQNFINRLMTDEKSPVVLIVDGDLASHARKAGTFINKFNGRLQLFAVPNFESDKAPHEICPSPTLTRR
jgi:transposase